MKRAPASTPAESDSKLPASQVGRRRPETLLLGAKADIIVLLKLLLQREEGLTLQIAEKHLGCSSATACRRMKVLRKMGLLRVEGNSVCMRFTLRKELRSYAATLVDEWSSVKREHQLRCHDGRFSATVDGLVVLNSRFRNITKEHNWGLTECTWGENFGWWVKTPLGSMQYFAKSNTVAFRVANGLVPVRASDIPELADVICTTYGKLYELLLETLRPLLEGCRIRITSVHLVRMEVGVVVKKDVQEAIEIASRVLGKDPPGDKSVPGCDEFEAKGTPEEVIPLIEQLLTEFFRHKVYCWGVDSCSGE